MSNKGTFVGAERAIWLYAFNKDALDKYHDGSKTARLEKMEDNEIIRFLEIGVPVYCTDMIGDSWAVDEPKDLDIVKQKMDELNKL